MARKTNGKLARTTKYFKNLQRFRQIQVLPQHKKFWLTERKGPPTGGKKR